MANNLLVTSQVIRLICISNMLLYALNKDTTMKIYSYRQTVKIQGSICGVTLSQALVLSSIQHFVLGILLCTHCRPVICHVIYELYDILCVYDIGYLNWLLNAIKHNSPELRFSFVCCIWWNCYILVFSQGLLYIIEYMLWNYIFVHSIKIFRFLLQKLYNLHMLTLAYKLYRQLLCSTSLIVN